MTWSQPQSSPTAFSFASSPLAPPTRPRIPSAMSEYSSPQPAAPCAALLSSPTASSTSRGNFSRRRSQYKSRSPTSSSAAASSPLLFDRWHDRLLQSCAQRVKENRQQSLQQSRSGFQCEERTEHFSEEEQAIASRIYARDEARRRQALEHEFQLQQFDTITEQDLQELGMQGPSQLSISPNTPLT